MVSRDPRWIKINFYGASKGNPCPSRIGTIERNAEGSIIAIGEKCVADGTYNQVECLVVVEAVLMGIKLEAWHLHLEGDSQIVVNGGLKGGVDT